MTDVIARMSNILRGVELELSECDTTRSFLRHCQAFRDQILGDEQLNNAYATWLDLTLKRRGLRPLDARWKILRNLATRPSGKTEEARRTRALATLSGYILWEKTEYYKFHLASRPMLESAVALTRSTSFDWAAFARRINCAMLRTHLKAVEHAQGRQITMIDGRSFRNADIKVASKTAASNEMLSLVDQWAECSDGHMWLDNGECLARRPYVRMYLLQYDAFGVLVPRTNVQQIRPCDRCHHPRTPSIGLDPAHVLSEEQQPLSMNATADDGSPPQVRRPSVGGKGPKLTVVRMSAPSCSRFRTSSTTQRPSKPQSSCSDMENWNILEDEQTQNSNTETPGEEWRCLNIDTEMLDVLENSRVGFQSSLPPLSPFFDADLHEQCTLSLPITRPESPLDQLYVSPSRSINPLLPASRDITLPRPPIEPALNEAYNLALEQCIIHPLRLSLSTWTDELRSASVYCDPAGLATSTTAQCTADIWCADIWCMDEQTFCRFAQDQSFDRPILIKEKFKDDVDFSLDRCVREIRDRLGGSELDVQSPSSTNGEHIHCEAFVRALQQTERAYSAPHLPPWADANKPRLTSLPRYRLLKMLVERLQIQRGTDESNMSALRDMTAGYNTISARGAFSGARIDVLTGGWVRNLLGKTLWLFVPRKAMTSDDWDCFTKRGMGWNPQGKARAVILHVGDVLFIPPGLHVVYSLLTLETSWIEGGIVWDELSIAPLLESLRWLGYVQGGEKDPNACFLNEVLPVLDEVLTADPGRFARGENDSDFLRRVKVMVQEIAAFFPRDSSWS